MISLITSTYISGSKISNMVSGDDWRWRIVELVRLVVGNRDCWLWEGSDPQKLSLYGFPVSENAHFLDSLCQQAIAAHCFELSKGKFCLVSLPNHNVILCPGFLDHHYLCGLGLSVPGNDFSWSSEDNLPLQKLVDHYAWSYHLHRQLETSLTPPQRTIEDLSHIHHELRTPLTGILGFSKMLKEELYGPLNDKQKQYVQGILTSGDHLLSLVNDFLDLAKIDAQREDLFLEWVAVEDLCLSALSMVQARALEKGLDLCLTLAPEVTRCRVDPKRIKQVLLNLLSNAVKFTLTGTVKLTGQMQGENLVLTVIDTGIGIKAEDQARLFQPFQQIHHALNRQQKGTGLGLVLARKLAQLHGGDISLTSTEGQGSCFSLCLPQPELCHGDRLGSKPEKKIGL